MMLGAAIIGPIEVVVSASEPSSSHLPEAILGFASTVIWGGIILLALIVFRVPIRNFLATLGGRITKLSIVGVELELAAVPKAELTEDAKSFGGMDPQDLTSTTSFALQRALDGPMLPHSYAIIDLGIGKSWLISRLFIFAIMLRQVRGVRCFVFLDRSSGVPFKYLGTVSTEDVRGAFAQHYPWLERIFAKAYKDKLWNFPITAETMEKPRRLDRNFAATVLQEFVLLLKQERWFPSANNPNQTPPEQLPSDVKSRISAGPWVQVGGNMEYGTWINSELLFIDFKGVIQTDQMPLALRTQDKLAELVNCRASFVALVRSSGQFVALVDRAKILEDLVPNPADKG